MIDLSIVILYLLGMLVIGVWQGRGIRDMEEYAVTKHKYSGLVMGVALSATILGGGSTVGIAEKVFSVGLIFVLAVVGQPINKLFIAHFVAPKMDRFRGMISAGDIMGSFYGKPGRVITGVVGGLMSVGLLGAQISALGYLFHYFLDVPYVYGVALGSGIVTIYTVTGGIKAVTMTDLFQFGILIIAIPMICGVSLYELGGWTKVLERVPSGHIFIAEDTGLMLRHIVLLLVFMIPLLNPAIIQRLLMTKNSKESVKGIMITACISLGFLVIAGFIGLIALATNPALEANLALPYLINTVLPVGLKGLAISGMLAVIMSTADSNLNVAGITIVHDVIKPLRRGELSEIGELRLTRLVTFALGAMGVVVCLFNKSIYDIILGSFMVWGPVVVVPFYAGLFGLNASTRTFLLSAIAGVSMWIVWDIVLKSNLGVNALIPSILANGVVFALSHYLESFKRRALG